MAEGEGENVNDALSSALEQLGTGGDEAGAPAEGGDAGEAIAPSAEGANADESAGNDGTEPKEGSRAPSGAKAGSAGGREEPTNAAGSGEEQVR